MRTLPVVLALALAVGACGGKILEEAGAGSSGSSGRGSSGTSSGGSTSGSSGFGGVDPEPPSQQEPPARSDPDPAPSGKSSVADACETICHRNGQCGAWQSDCKEHCESEISSAAACSPQAKAYIHCYADNLEADSCSALPPVCEDAYCAYTRCAGKVVPKYCR